MSAKKKKAEEEIEYIQEAPPPGEGNGRPDAPDGPAGDREGEESPESAAAASPAAGDKLKKRESELRHLRKELAELKEQYLRKLAETENLRKRFDREKSEYQQFATADLLAELLEILDNFERALRSSSQEGNEKTIREGVDLIYRMFQNFLTRKGVQPIEIKDGIFDPNLHHAMATEESGEVDEPEVTEELQKGYMLSNRLLRPTLVRVAVPKKGQ